VPKLSRVILKHLEPAYRKGFARGERDGYERGKAELLAGLKAVADLNGSAARLLKAAPEPPPDDAGDDAGDPHALLTAALIDAVTEARADGDDDAVPGLIAAYRDHLDDPDALAALMPAGPQRKALIGAVFVKAWSEDHHPRDDERLADEMLSEMGVGS
jgi:hypothetical protein